MDDDVAEDKPAGRVGVLILQGKVLLAPTDSGSLSPIGECARHLPLSGHVQAACRRGLAWISTCPYPVPTATQQCDCTVSLAITVSIRMTIQTSSKPSRLTSSHSVRR
jgi:hypothetical protein